MSDISKAVGETSPELIEALKNAASVAEMTEIRRKFLVDHGAERDRFSPDKLTFDHFDLDEASAASGKISRVVKIRGVDQTFTASNLLDLERAIGAALQAAGTTEDANAERSTMQARHPKSGRFFDPQNPAEQAELKAMLVRGEITSEQYISAQPQLLDGIMRERYNIDPEKVESDRTTNRWVAATEEFLNSPAGADFPRSEENKNRLAQILEENDLTNSPSVETLTRAYQHMKEHGLLVTPPEVEAQKSISEATSFEDLRQAAWKSAGGRPSSVWSR